MKVQCSQCKKKFNSNHDFNMHECPVVAALSPDELRAKFEALQRPKSQVIREWAEANGVKVVDLPAVVPVLDVAQVNPTWHAEQVKTMEQNVVRKNSYHYVFEIETFHELDQQELDNLECALAAQLEDISLCWKSKLKKL